jgi:hypothetical protein
MNDEAALRAAITLPRSNGQTQGQITRLNLVKRQMYGRGKLDLLQARLIGTELYQIRVKAKFEHRLTARAIARRLRTDNAQRLLSWFCPA